MDISYDNEGNPVDYAKFSLKFISKVESGDYKGLFYKFKVVDRKMAPWESEEKIYMQRL